MSENKAILAKLHKIMLAVPYLQKDAANPHHKYNYASEKAIKEAVGKALRDNGVVFSLNVSNIMREGGKTDITCDYGFHDVDTGECFSGHFLGCGPDRDDKGLYIAITGAIKYILTTTLLIATGDDPEVVREDSNEQPASQSPVPRPAKPSSGLPEGAEREMPSTKTDGYCWFCDQKRHIQKGDMVVLAKISGKDDPVWGAKDCYIKNVLKSRAESGPEIPQSEDDRKVELVSEIEKWETVRFGDPNNIKNASAIEAARKERMGTADLLKASEVGMENYLEYLKKD